ncbi:MAG: YlbF family regulator [Clostridia bacterium]|nr:YlbF family regulator [Clostridia bacterium]
MDLITLSKNLGAEIQKSDEYLEYKIREQNVECDKDLQKLIETFNLKKVAINEEISKSEADHKKIDKLNSEISSLYSKIMENETMKEFNKSKEKFENTLRKINYIITASAGGQDPYTINTDDVSSCTGSCSGCSGCN